MKRIGFALLFVAAIVCVVQTTIFGGRFWEELSSWLLIVVVMIAAGCTLIGAAHLSRTRQGDGQPESS